jgi:hypothetical protein
MKWLRRLRKPSPTDADVERADQWLRREFQRETERIERETPAGLLDRCLRVARTDAEQEEPVPTWRPIVAWASVVVLAVALAGVLIWQMPGIGTSSSRSVAHRDDRAMQPRELSNAPGRATTAIDATSNRPAVPQQSPRDQATVIVRRPHTNLPVAHREPPSRSANQPLVSRHTHAVPSADEPVPHSTSINEQGEAVTTVAMEPVSPHESAAGTVQMHAAGESDETVTRITLDASGLVPDKTYQMFVQVTDSADPVFIAEGKSDGRGLLALNVPVTPEHIAAIRNARNQTAETSPAATTHVGRSVTNAGPATVDAAGSSQSSISHPTVAAVSPSTSHSAGESSASESSGRVIPISSMGSPFLTTDMGEIVLRPSTTNPGSNP